MKLLLLCYMWSKIKRFFYMSGLIYSAFFEWNFIFLFFWNLSFLPIPRIDATMYLISQMITLKKMICFWSKDLNYVNQTCLVFMLFFFIVGYNTMIKPLTPNIVY